ncbi:MAG: hypothetical protein IKN63_06505 [Bacilli bacterium]|nr:hypothetical protein [Bacilli bacterium]
MNYYLVFHLDRNGKNGIVLYHTNDLEEMDEFIGVRFRNRNDVIKIFNNDIGEFCLDRMDSIKNENLRNNHNRLGSVSLFCRYQNNYGTFTYKIPIIYKNDKKLLPDDECLKKIEKSLNDDNKLKKLFNEKSYLLSKNEYELIILYFRHHDERRKKEFIYHFINRILEMSDIKKYFFFRSLMNVCNLNQVIDNDLEVKDNLKKPKNESYSDDDYFTSLVEKSDYDMLNKYYDLEKIMRDSNIYKK